MSMAGAVNRMGDLVGQVLEDSPTPATPPPSIPTPSTDYSTKAFDNLAKDTSLSMEMRSFIGALFLRDDQEKFLRMYAVMSDGPLRHGIAQRHYELAQRGSSVATAAAPLPGPSSISPSSGLSLFSPPDAQPDLSTPFDPNSFLNWGADFGTGGGDGMNF